MPSQKKKHRKKKSSKEFREVLLTKHKEVKEGFNEKYPHAEKYFREKGTEIGRVRQHSAKIIGAGALTGSLLISPPTGVKALPAPHEVIEKVRLAGGTIEAEGMQKVLVDSLKLVIPERPRPLSREEEKHLEQLFNETTGIKAKATLEGEHLNTTYGYIGAEQHLRRYPGDTINGHGTPSIQRSGLAPGLGAWGYFANSKAEMSHSLVETEKWYAVVQTLYLPDWGTRQPHLKNWYKHRKVFIVNTQNGNAVICAVADSGPAAWTGKHFGGSPEVMHYLGGSRYKKGAVIIFFVDDPENKIPLGPVEYNEVSIPDIQLEEA
ncbi:hypothetical protein ACFL0F_01400 [Patescibacteria group bacterium]